MFIIKIQQKLRFTMEKNLEKQQNRKILQ